MSERNFSRRRRGGMRFRPSGGLGAHGQHPDRTAQQARAEAGGDKPVQDAIFDSRHEREIQRAENRAAGVPTAPPPGPEPAPTATAPSRQDFREPDLGIPAEVKEESAFSPVP